MSQFDNPKEKVRVIVELEGAPAIEYATKQGVMFKDLTQSKKTQLQSTVKNQQTDFLSTIKKKKISFKVENTFTTVFHMYSLGLFLVQIVDLRITIKMRVIEIQSYSVFDRSNLF